jgi:hypothetical protein
LWGKRLDGTAKARLMIFGSSGQIIRPDSQMRCVVNAFAVPKQQDLRTFMLNTGNLTDGVGKVAVANQIEIPSPWHGCHFLPFVETTQGRGTDTAARAVLENELGDLVTGLQQRFKLLRVFERLKTGGQRLLSVFTLFIPFTVGQPRPFLATQDCRTSMLPIRNIAVILNLLFTTYRL